MLHDLEYKPDHYLAYQIPQADRSFLLRKQKPRFSEVICDHVTIIYDLTDLKLYHYKKAHITEPSVRVNGFIGGTSVEAFSVIIAGMAHRPDGKNFHITLSVEPPHEAVEANELFGRGTPDLWWTTHKLSGQFLLLPK